MALSDKHILSAMNAGDVVIYPFNYPNLSTSSYDVCLGKFFFREQRPAFAGNVFNIYNQQHVERVWGKPREAESAQEIIGPNLCDDMDLDRKARIIMIEPGETILSHTQEFIGGRDHITTMMKARSSLGRSFVTVCKCAGWGDVGYINRWTMEITNVSRYYSIPLIVGARVAQIVFLETGEIKDLDYTLNGNYQQTDNLQSLIANWKPESMLPRTHL